MDFLQKKVPVSVLIIAVIAIAFIEGIVLLGFFGGRAGTSMDDETVVARVNGQSVRAGEAFKSIKNKLFEQEEEAFRLKEQTLNDHIDNVLLEAEAKKQNLSPMQLLEKETGGDLKEVTDQDITEFLKSKNLSLSDPRIKKEDVREYLRFKQKYDKRQVYMDKLKAGAKIEFLIPEPASPKLIVGTDGYPAWGNTGAKVTIVEFSDFQCPFCSRAVPVIQEIKKAYGPDKVRIVFRDMPLPNHPRAKAAAMAARCANEQGKFWEFHDTLFEHQDKLEDGDFKQHAKTLKLDSGKFDECLASNRHAPAIEKSKTEAEALGISATPSFVVNGVLIQGARPFADFKQKIDRALRGG